MGSPVQDNSSSTRKATGMKNTALTLFFLLGDLGYYDCHGRFYYVDRIKDLIAYHSYYVSPTELEDILLSHLAVQEACVVGVPHPIRGDDATAFVVVHDTFLPSDDLGSELKMLVEEQTPEHKHLYGGVIFVDSIPKNGRGKPLKRQLRCRAKAARGCNSMESAIVSEHENHP